MTNRKIQPDMRLISQKMVFILILMLVSNLSLKAERIITGVVRDSISNTAIIGVNVLLRGTTIRTTSDVNGLFQLMVPDSQAVLIFSFIGYEKKKIALHDVNMLDVFLQPSTTKLDEVTVIGYGTVPQKKMLYGACAVETSSSPLTRIRGAGRIMHKQMPMPNESYSKIHSNGFKAIEANPLSTFSIDVDRASYANVRRFIRQGQLPPADAVRVEEMINYFSYGYPQPENEHPFSINTEYTECPWQDEHKLLRIGLQGKKVETENLPASNLVFLIDVSGSMNSSNKLPLVKSAFSLLTKNLRSIDRVAIVVYAGAAGLVLPSTDGNEKQKILDALNSLNAGGSTAGSDGIELAYKVAKENFIENGNNRVILATDGDFNVGIQNENELEDFITSKRKDRIFLTCLGFGMGNYKDSKMEILADKGNGNYAYINDMLEANKIFIQEFGGTLFTIAKDVKIQIEFNPNEVQAYRLIGYENRLLNDEDFNDDTKDAGELGAGHTVTALYEIIPTGISSPFHPNVDDLKYQKPKHSSLANTNEVATVKFRYKNPEGHKSIKLEQSISSNCMIFESSSSNTRFAASVAMFGMLLTNSEYLGNTNYDQIIAIGNHAKDNDDEGYRGEFIQLVKTARNISPITSK